MDAARRRPAMVGNGESKRRKKSVSRIEQRLPLVMSGTRSRTEQPVMMSTTTATDLLAYVRWVSKVAHVPADEAMVLTIDRAIGDLLRRDELWQAHRAEHALHDEEAPPPAVPGAGVARPAPVSGPAASGGGKP
jgi:hypothetical protein